MVLEQPVGPFRLEAPLGAGAFGEVWAAHHVANGTPVAVKIVPGSVRGFDREVRALAGVDHPNVVPIHDHGRGDGVQWVALGRAEASLADAPPTRWADVRTATRAMLSGLAHLHARGLVHRDVKPSNTLRTRAGTIWLSDLGLASPVDEALGTAGTPAFMAPEAFRGEHSAASDLYAVGCTVWTWVCGIPPFGTGHEAARGHAILPVPALAPVLPVPDGLEAWLRGLLAKRPQDRFRMAADARAALDGLDEARGAAAAATPSADETVATTDLGAFAWGLADDATSAPAPPPAPRAWRADIDLARAARRIPPGVGQALFGLRRWSLLARDPERERLWRALLEVVDTGTLRVVLLRGPSGIGTTALAEWIAHRATELGAAWTLRGLQDLAARLEGLDRPAVVLAGDLPAAEALRVGRLRQGAAIPALVVACARPDQEVPDATVLDVGPLSPVEMTLMVRECLQLTPEDAGRIAHRAAGNPGYAVALVRQGIEAGAFTATPEGYTGAAALPPDLRAAWAQRLEQAGAAADLPALELRVAAGPAASMDHVRAAWSRAGLAEPDATPWLDRGLVAGHARGWWLAPGPAAELLEEGARAAGRWVAHHLALAATAPDRRVRAHHLAAAGRGGEVFEDLLEGAEDLADRDLSSAMDALERLEGIASGWPEADPRTGRARMLRADIVAQLGRREEASELVAAVLTHAGEPGWRVPVALAHRHEGLMRSFGGDRAGSLEVLEAALKALDGRWKGRVLLTLGVQCAGLGQMDRALDLLDRAVRTAAEAGDALGEAAALRRRVIVLPDSGHTAERRALIDRALALAEPFGDTRVLAECLITKASVALEEDDLDEALRCNARAARIYDAGGFDHAVLAHGNLANVLLRRGEFARALEVIIAVHGRMVALNPRRHPAKTSVRGMWGVALAHLGRWEELDEQLAYIVEDHDAGIRYPHLATQLEGIAGACLAAGRAPTRERALGLALVQWTDLGWEDAAARVRDARSAK